MSLANSDSEDSMFGSEEFGSEINPGIGLGEADGGFIAQPNNDVAMPDGVAPPLPVKQKGFTLDSFLILISMLLMLTSAIILFSYLDKIEV